MVAESSGVSVSIAIFNAQSPYTARRRALAILREEEMTPSHRGAVIGLGVVRDLADRRFIA